jgi:Cytochrome P460
MLCLIVTIWLDLRMKPPIIFSILALLLLGLVVYSGMQRDSSPLAQPATFTARPLNAATQSTPTLAATPTYAPGREPMKLPKNYRENFILYTIVDRPDAITRKFYITPDAIVAIRNGLELPERTQILVEAYNAARDGAGNVLHDEQGHLIADSLQDEIHIAELRSEWQIEDLASTFALGKWNFDAFEVGTGTPRHEVRFDCFNCHSNAFSSNFLFTQAQLNGYADTGETQYMYCNQLARQPCTR